MAKKLTALEFLTRAIKRLANKGYTTLHIIWGTEENPDGLRKLFCDYYDASHEDFRATLEDLIEKGKIGFRGARGGGIIWIPTKSYKKVEKAKSTKRTNKALGKILK